MQLDADNRRFLEERTAALPAEWRESFARRYVRGAERAHAIPAGSGKQSAALQENNLWLMRATARAAEAWIPPGATDADLRELAAEKAGEFWQLADCTHDPAALRERMSRRCAQLGIVPPSTKVADLPAIRRMTSARWWRRKIRRTQGALVEEIAIALGYVHRRRECYCSDETVKRRRAQLRRNALALEAAELENQHGYTATIAELAAKSVSSPRIKHAELMTRMAGFESLARSIGYSAIFVTLTCPSRFHAVLENGRRNLRHDGSIPRDAQRHLVTAFARLRAALHRRGIAPFGFRVAEPHHDGTPHWHIVLFVAPEHLKTVRQLFTKYFLDQHDPDEHGARKNRVKFVDIDRNRGSAAGYIAKYITKGIDGEHLDADHYGNGGRTAAERVSAWAAAHSIRQFQQIGGPPVTIWRELRRLEAHPSHPEIIAAARSAADAGNWARYVEVMGGPGTARADLPVTLARTAAGMRLDPDTGETTATLNEYGEPSAPAIFGVRAAASGQAVLTRRFVWKPRSRAARGELRPEARHARPAPWRAARAGKAEGRAAGEAGGARTRVNNCTQAQPAPPDLPGEFDPIRPGVTHPADPLRRSIAAQPPPEPRHGLRNYPSDRA